MITRIPEASVPCNGCTACCRNEAIILYPEDGDVVANYACADITHPVTGEMVKALLQKRDGSCIYLGLAGCTIHGRAPVLCRAFDCRQFLINMRDRGVPREQLGALIADTPVLEAARARLHTLKESK